jgi:hypothetical protein
MSEDTTTKEALELVKEAQSAKVFNLSDAIKGRAYPTTTVKVFLDDESAMSLVNINQQLNRTTDEEETDKLEELAKELAENILKSALVFDMRGIGQDAIEAVTEQMNAKHSITNVADGPKNQDWMRDYITTLVGLNITCVTNAEGAEDREAFGLEKADQLRKALSPSEWGKLVGAMQKLTLAGGYFDQLTDAGFLPRS